MYSVQEDPKQKLSTILLSVDQPFEMVHSKMIFAQRLSLHCGILTVIPLFHLLAKISNYQHLQMSRNNNSAETAQGNRQDQRFYSV